MNMSPAQSAPEPFRAPLGYAMNLGSSPFFQQAAASTPQQAAPQAPQMPSDPQAATPAPMQTPVSAPQQSGGNFFSDLGTNPLFLGGLTMLSGQGPSAGAQIAHEGRRGKMEQAQWQLQQEQRQRMMDAWSRVFPNGAAAGDHPLLKGVPPEIASLAQTMGPEEGLAFLGKYAMSRQQKPLNPLQQAQLYNLINPGAAAAAKKQAELQVEAQQQLPGALADAETALDVIQKTRSHPGLAWGTGATANLPSWSPRARGFDALVKQLSGQAFLASIQKMRGLGSLSDAEGKAAREASARLETAQSKEEFLAALDDLQTLVQKGVQGAYARAGQTAPAASPDTSGWSVRRLD